MTINIIIALQVILSIFFLVWVFRKENREWKEIVELHKRETQQIKEGKDNVN